MKEEIFEEPRIIKKKIIIPMTDKYSLHLLLLEENNRHIIMLRLFSNIHQEYSLNKLLLMDPEEALKVSNALKEILEEIGGREE